MRVFQNFWGRRRVFLGFFDGFLLALEKILKIDRVQPLVFLKDQDFEPPNFLAIKFLIRLRRRIDFWRAGHWDPDASRGGPRGQKMRFQRLDPIIPSRFPVAIQ